MFTEQGAKISELTIPESYQQLVHDWALTTGVECARAHRDWFADRQNEYGPVLKSLIELGLSVGEDTYRGLEKLRQQFSSDLDAVLDGVDVLLCPNMPALAPTAAEMLDVSLQDPDRADFLTFTAPFDYSGHPTITLPAGVGEGRLPKTIQLIGGKLQESMLIRCGAGFEAAAGAGEHPLS